jgi:hypothetical protein
LSCLFFLRDGCSPRIEDPDTAGRRGETRVGGEVAGGWEGAAVADLDQDAGSGPDAHSRHRRQDPRKRVSLQEFLDPPGQQSPLVKDVGQGSGEARDDQRGRFGAGTVTVCSSRAVKMSSTSRSAILGAFGRNRVACRRRQALRIWPGEPNRSSKVGTAARCNRGPSTRSLRRRMNLREQAVQPVRDPGRFAGQVIVEADDHLQLGDRPFLAVDDLQRMAGPVPSAPSSRLCTHC